MSVTVRAACTCKTRTLLRMGCRCGALTSDGEDLIPYLRASELDRRWRRWNRLHKAAAPVRAVGGMGRAEQEALLHLDAAATALRGGDHSLAAQRAGRAQRLAYGMNAELECRRIAEEGMT